MIPITKPQYIRELGAVEIGAIRDLTARISEKVWDAENARKENDFECFHHTRHIIFRFIEDNRDCRVFYSKPGWAVWQSHLLPLFNRISEQYNFKQPAYPKAMLARLAAGAFIDRHTDGAGSNLCTHKIHVPIETNEQARMFIGDSDFHLEAGRAYEVNNIVPHAVENQGATDRIHLIFEVFDQAAQ